MPWREANASAVGCGKHHVLLVRLHHHRIHDIHHKDGAIDSRVDGAMDIADDMRSDVERDIHGAGGEEGVAEEEDHTDDEVDDRNREKLELEGGLEVLRVIPMLVVDLLNLGQGETNSLEAALSVHFEEEFAAGEAVVDAVVEGDRIVEPDLLMDVDDAHIVHSIDAHTVLHGHMPPHNLRK